MHAFLDQADLKQALQCFPFLPNRAGISGTEGCQVQSPKLEMTGNADDRYICICKFAQYVWGEGAVLACPPACKHLQLLGDVVLDGGALYNFNTSRLSDCSSSLSFTSRIIRDAAQEREISGDCQRLIARLLQAAPYSMHPQIHAAAFAAGIFCKSQALVQLVVRCTSQLMRILLRLWLFTKRATLLQR